MEKLQILAVKRNKQGFLVWQHTSCLTLLCPHPYIVSSNLLVSTKILYPHLFLICTFKKNSSNFNAVALENDHLNGLLMGDKNIFVFYLKKACRRDPNYEILHIWKKY
jgi:hypothetical protein